MTLDYFFHLRSRLPFPVMQEYCSRLELPTAQGWDKLEDKFTDLHRHDPERIDELLAQIFREALPVGERAVQLYALTVEDISRFRPLLEAIHTQQDSIYMDSYPAPLEQDQLATVPDGLVLCEVSRVDDVVSLVFCTRRIQEDREPRTRDEIGNAAVQQFGWQDYDEFVFIRRRYIQCYEVVRFDLTNRIVEVRVEEKTGVDTSGSMNQVRVALDHLLMVPNNPSSLPLPVNFFPAIRSMYNAESEGIVVELGFTTETGSAKHEKMRRQGSDLRDEPFHVGGSAAIQGALTPFRIAIRWSAEHGVPGEVILPGSIRQLGNPMPRLDYLILKNAHSEAVTRACIDRVVRHLSDDRA
ncbi:hypothetical protein QWZ03_09880 [Chitinimonas viridis]|uniref:PD-(D/E)XK nuclease family protein n=1 Tax=Chitinimonas viridis TaxID=664880 RepID=A0ABT8B483_9NEIS|nr:hypothetical protein [Chitinimonas viridis]MDN3577073.1 hypothetical protein [Chitinimonas viridis]